MITREYRKKMYIVYFLGIMAFMALSEITHQILELYVRCNGT